MLSTRRAFDFSFNFTNFFENRWQKTVPLIIRLIYEDVSQSSVSSIPSFPTSEEVIVIFKSEFLKALEGNGTMLHSRSINAEVIYKSIISLKPKSFSEIIDNLKSQNCAMKR